MPPFPLFPRPSLKITMDFEEATPLPRCLQDIMSQSMQTTFDFIRQQEDTHGFAWITTYQQRSGADDQLTQIFTILCNSDLFHPIQVLDLVPSTAPILHRQNLLILAVFFLLKRNFPGIHLD